MRHPGLPLLALIVLVAGGCSRQLPVAPTSNTATPSADLRVNLESLDRLERIATLPDGGVGEMSLGHRLVVVPAGSNNALANAIAAAGDGGVVLLRPGAHAESHMVTVDRSVTLMGQSGAELISGAGAPSPADPADVLAPALYVTAAGASIWGLTIRSTPGDGNTAILVHGGDDALVYRNKIVGFQFGVIVDPGERVRVWNNAISITSAWQSGAVGDAFGIVVVNGSRASVLRNDVTNAVFGIWACGSDGLLAYNLSHDSFIGIILCTVPAGAFQLPDGTLSGALVSCTRWAATENVTLNNLTNGFLAIDRANHNLIASNASSGNGTYDIELAGDSYRFGFLTPACYDNLFIAGHYPNVEVKNCGTNNTVIGGTLVDNTTEPCD